jgi:hypothetical protein
MGPNLDGPREEVKLMTPIKIGGKVNEYFEVRDSRRGHSLIVNEEQGQ